MGYLTAFNLGLLIGVLGVFYHRDKARDQQKVIIERAVANGCAIRVLDSASGEVKTVWKDGKP